MFRTAPSCLAFALALIAGADRTARAEMPPQPNERATLIVEGVVRESFRSVRATRIDSLFEIEVRSAQAGGTPETPFAGVLPRPGDLIHVLVFQRRPDAPQVPGPGGYRDLPGEHDLVRAFVYPRNGGGGWQFAYPLGFERLGRAESPFPAEPADVLPGAGPGAMPTRRIGVMVTPVSLGNRPGLQVTAVTPGTPAGRAGLDPGDVILEADGVSTRTLADLTSQVARAGARIHLVIHNIRTGRIQPFDIDLGGAE